MIPEVTVSELEKAQADGAVIVDVREPHEYQSGHVPGAISIPLGVVPVRAAELPKTRPVYVVCQSGGRSYQVAEALARAGLDARSVAGGTGAWVRAGRAIALGQNPR